MKFWHQAHSDKWFSSQLFIAGLSPVLALENKPEFEIDTQLVVEEKRPSSRLKSMEARAQKGHKNRKKRDHRQR